MKKFLLILLLILVAGVLLAPFFLQKQMNLSLSREMVCAPADMYSSLAEVKNVSEWYYDEDSLNAEFFSPYIGEGALYEILDSTNTVQRGGEILRAKQDSLVEIVAYDSIAETSDTIIYSIADMSAGRLRLDVAVKGVKIPYFERYFLSNKKMKEKAIWENRLNRLEEFLKNKSEETAEPREAEEKFGEVVFEQFSGVKVLTMPNQTTNDSIEIKTAIKESAAQVRSYLVDVKKLNPDEIEGPIAYWHYWDDKSGEQEFFVGYAFRSSVEYPEEFMLKAIPGSPTASLLLNEEISTQTENVLKVRNELTASNLVYGEQVWMIYDMENKGQPKLKIFVPVIP